MGSSTGGIALLSNSCMKKMTLITVLIFQGSWPTVCSQYNARGAGSPSQSYKKNGCLLCLRQWPFLLKFYSGVLKTLQKRPVYVVFSLYLIQVRLSVGGNADITVPSCLYSTVCNMLSVLTTLSTEKQKQFLKLSLIELSIWHTS